MKYVLIQGFDGKTYQEITAEHNQTYKGNKSNVAVGKDQNGAESLEGMLYMCFKRTYFYITWYEQPATKFSFGVVRPKLAATICP